MRCLAIVLASLLATATIPAQENPRPLNGTISVVNNGPSFYGQKLWLSRPRPPHGAYSSYEVFYATGGTNYPGGCYAGNIKMVALVASLAPLMAQPVYLPANIGSSTFAVRLAQVDALSVVPGGGSAYTPRGFRLGYIIPGAWPIGTQLHLQAFELTDLWCQAAPGGYSQRFYDVIVSSHTSTITRT